MTTRSYWKPCKLHKEPAGRCETQLGPLIMSSCPSISITPPNIFTCLICGESYMYILSPEEQFLSTQCRWHSVLWHTGSYRIIIMIISNIISLLHLTLRKSKLTFLDCRYASPSSIKGKWTEIYVRVYPLLILNYQHIYILLVGRIRCKLPTHKVPTVYNSFAKIPMLEVLCWKFLMFKVPGLQVPT
jgi:hypothetical protein